MPPDPSKWKFPSRGVPDSYLDFLRWSNGGNFQNGDRVFEFYPCEGVRSIMITYYTPAFAPHLVPFASDQAERGNRYGFDTSADPLNGEFPILFGQWNSLGDDFYLAETFVDACRATTDPEVLYWDARGGRSRETRASPSCGRYRRSGSVLCARRFSSSWHTRRYLNSTP